MMKHVWIIGSGQMAMDYIKILKELNISFEVIGRGETSAKICRSTTGHEVFSGGLKAFLETKPQICSHAIIAVGVEELAKTAIELILYGVKNILTEKPAGLNSTQITEVDQLAQVKKVNVYVAYNRRFYASTQKVKELIEADGGVTSFNFEFTEWAHVIEPLQKAKGVKENWFLANSTHVADLAFFLGGKPKELCSFIAGKLTWHPSGSIFSGAGVSENGALFNYQANWESAGRWCVEILTKEHRFILRPMEKLQIQKKGTITQDFYTEIDYSLDEKYKPGLYLQTVNFLNGKNDEMCTIHDQVEMLNIYKKISKYGE